MVEDGGVLGAGLAGAELVEEEEVLEDVEVLFEDEEEDLLEEPEYRSAYQPPPLRMKLPDETRRLAVLLLQAGHTSKGGSTMLCSCSHS